MRFLEGEAWERIRRRYKYRLLQSLALELPLTVLPHGEQSAELVDADGEPIISIRRTWRSQGKGPGGEVTWESGAIDDLVIVVGYAWDGPSGPAIDTGTFMRSSLVHDALYQMIREGRLPESARAKADAIMRKLAQEDGMGRARAWWTWAAVRLFGGSSARAEA